MVGCIEGWVEGCPVGVVAMGFGVGRVVGFGGTVDGWTGA